jgi:hypothetical protein
MKLAENLELEKVAALNTKSRGPCEHGVKPLE